VTDPLNPKSGTITITKIPDVLSDELPLPPPMTVYDATMYRWALVPVIFVDQATWRIVVANHPAEELFGYNLGEMYGMSVHELVPPLLRADHGGHAAAFADEPYQTARPMGQGMTVMGHHRKGADFPVNVALYRLVHMGRRYVLAEIVDMRTGRTAHPVPARPAPAGDKRG
jgi:PAS domain S-box-containing protein